MESEMDSENISPNVQRDNVDQLKVTSFEQMNSSDDTGFFKNFDNHLIDSQSEQGASSKVQFVTGTNTGYVSEDFNESQLNTIQLNTIPLYDSSKSIDEEDLKSPPLRKPKIDHEWELFCQFSSANEATSSIDSKMWSRYRKSNTEDGVKQYFRCNKVKLRGPQCAAAIYHLFVSDSDIVLEFRTKSDHTHDDLVDVDIKEKRIKLEAEVQKLVQLNIKRKRIVRELSQIDGIIMPTLQQLTTLIAKIRNKIYGPVTISMQELSKWLEIHQKVPIDMHEPFVLSHEMDCECDEPFFRFVISTKHLLGLTKLRDFSHCDTTYKCIWQGFPVFMIGTTDYEKAYHPYGLCVCTFEQKEDFKFLFQSLKDRAREILGFEMAQKSLVCDAAFAIINAFKEVFGDDVIVVMCWYHAKVAIEDKLSIVKLENRAEILSDIELLHNASNPQIFDKAASMFLNKWSGMESAFCEYFNDQWLSKHRNWFLGAAEFTPCHNNALESSNRYLKDSNTIRVRHPLHHFLQVAMKTVGEWSNDFTLGLRKFATKPKIDLPLWTKGYNWAKANVETKIISQSDASMTVEIQAEVIASIKPASDAIVISEAIVISKETISEVAAKTAAQTMRPKVTACGSIVTRGSGKVNESESQPGIEMGFTSQPMASKVTTRGSSSTVAKMKDSLSQSASVSVLLSQPMASRVTTRGSRSTVAKVNESPSQLASVSVLQSQAMASKVTARGSWKTVAPSSQPLNDFLSQDNFDEYKKSFCKWTATIAKNSNVLYESRCNCPPFAKEYICKHVVGLGIRLKLIAAPPEAKTVAIGQKRKRGCPTKTKPALLVQ